METLFYTLGSIAFFVYLWNTVHSKDPTDGKERSGMILRTDYGTGRQYLESINGGITPRLNEKPLVTSFKDKKTGVEYIGIEGFGLTKRAE